MYINEIIRKALMAGIGVPEKLKELIDELVQKGELSKGQGAKIVKECSEKLSKSEEDISKSITELINKTLEKVNITTKDDVKKLEKKLTNLSSRVKKLEESSQAKEL